MITHDLPTEVSKIFCDHKQYLITFCQDQLSIMQPRDNYRELLELTIIASGAIPPRGIKFYQPGALHRARCMTRLIYGTKMFLFRNQFFKSSPLKNQANSRFASFVVLIYVEHWYTARSAITALNNDLRFLRYLIFF